MNRQFLKLPCTDSMLHKFTSKHSYQLSRTFIGLLCLFELQDLLHQASRLQNKELVGYSSFPGFMMADISARLSTLPSLAFRIKGLNFGFPLLIDPIVDYSFPDSKHFVLNMLFTVPEIPDKNSFCTLEYVTMIKYIVSGTCCTSLITGHDLALVTSPDSRFLLLTTSLSKCFHNESTYLRPPQVLALVNTTSWLGVPWTPASKLPFLQTHKEAFDCSGLNDLYHLGGRYYLSPNS